MYMMCEDNATRKTMGNVSHLIYFKFQDIHVYIHNMKCVIDLIVWPEQSDVK